MSFSLQPCSHLYGFLVKLSSIESVSFTDVRAYKKLIGRLMYLTNTRPDITFPVQQISQFLDEPTITHYNTTIRILKYIKSAPSLGLFFSSKQFCPSKSLL